MYEPPFSAQKNQKEGVQKEEKDKPAQEEPKAPDSPQ
jgi:hypothetical protein